MAPLKKTGFYRWAAAGEAALDFRSVQVFEPFNTKRKRESQKRTKFPPSMLSAPSETVFIWNVTAVANERAYFTIQEEELGRSQRILPLPCRQTVHHSSRCGVRAHSSQVRPGEHGPLQASLAGRGQGQPAQVPLLTCKERKVWLFTGTQQHRWCCWQRGPGNVSLHLWSPARWWRSEEGSEAAPPK